MLFKRNIYYAFFFIICSFLVVEGHAANDTIPEFKMMLSKGTVFSAKQLPKGKPLIIIYFSPECEHCIKLMNGFFQKINEYKKAEIVLMSFKPLSDLPDFEMKYHTYSYPNIKVGTEGTSYYLRYYFKIEKTPFVAFYDKKGNLFATLNHEPTGEDVLKKYREMK